MRRVFADTVYWIAVTSPHDQWHGLALAVSQTLKGIPIVTTDEVLSEFLAHFCGHGQKVRQGAVRTVENIRSDPTVIIHPQSRQSFLDGFALYKARPDKEYSLTDCISMNAMRQEGITEVLTRDDHFAQEGFIRLL
jgi:predicted nucleic acid-binding protein